MKSLIFICTNNIKNLSALHKAFLLVEIPAQSSVSQADAEKLVMQVDKLEETVKLVSLKF